MVLGRWPKIDDPPPVCHFGASGLGETMLRIATISLLLMSTGSVIAAPREDILRDAAFTVAAFECDALADNGKGMRTDLFMKGYESGKAFFQAIYARQLATEDYSFIPDEVRRVIIPGPTVDFKLGVLYARSQQRILTVLAAKTPSQSSESDRWIAAREEYGSRNCSFL